MGTGVRHRSSASARAEAASPQPTRTSASPTPRAARSALASQRPQSTTVRAAPAASRAASTGPSLGSAASAHPRRSPASTGDEWMDGNCEARAGRKTASAASRSAHRTPGARPSAGRRTPGACPEASMRGHEARKARARHRAVVPTPPCHPDGQGRHGHESDEEAQAPGRAPQGEGGEDPHEDRLVLGEAQLPGGAHAHARRGGSRRLGGPLPRDDEVGRRPLGDDPHSRQGGDGDSALPLPLGEADHGDCGFLRRVHAPSTPPADPSAPLAVPALWTRPRGLNGLWIPARGPSRTTGAGADGSSRTTAAGADCPSRITPAVSPSWFCAALRFPMSHTRDGIRKHGTAHKGLIPPLCATRVA